MKVYDGKTYKFLCDKCFEIAGISDDERLALEQARKTASVYGWEWFHPHWGLFCNKCLEHDKNVRTHM